MNTPFPILDSAAWFELATKAANRVKIYTNCWHEGEFACVLGSNPAEAAQKALGVAETVAKTRRVLLFDLQGHLRNYAECARAPRNLLRVNLDLATLDPKDIDGFMTGVEQTITASGADVCVIDSLFHLCEWRGKSAGARFFILRIREMTRRLGISLLLGATARKRIPKNAKIGAEHLPKGTAPFIDAIITEDCAPEDEKNTAIAVPATDRSVGSDSSEPKTPIIPRKPSGTGSAIRPKLSHRLSHPGLQARK